MFNCGARRLSLPMGKIKGRALGLQRAGVGTWGPEQGAKREWAGPGSHRESTAGNGQLVQTG